MTLDHEDIEAIAERAAHREGIASERSAHMVLREQGAWLCQLQRAQRGQSTVRAYRAAIDDLLAWARREHRAGDLFEQQTIIDYLADYQQRRHPTPATYLQRLVLLRTFIKWLSRRQGTPNPFLELPRPPDPRRRERDWLTREEFAQLLVGADQPQRNMPGLAARDRLVLTALVLTGISPKEMIAVPWTDVEPNGPHPSLRASNGKRATHRSIPLPSQLAAELQHWRELREPTSTDPVFCGLYGGRLRAEKLERIITRVANQASLEKHVNAHTLRYSATKWLKNAGGEEWLIDEYLGQSSIHYPGLVAKDLREAMQRLADHVLDDRPLAIEPARWQASPW